MACFGRAVAKSVGSKRIRLLMNTFCARPARQRQSPHGFQIMRLSPHSLLEEKYEINDSRSSQPLQVF